MSSTLPTGQEATGPRPTAIGSDDTATPDPADAAPHPSPARADWRAVLRARRIPVGIGTAVLTIVAVLRLGPHLSALPVLAFAAAAVALAVIDFQILRLPNLILGATALAAVAGCLAQASAEHDGRLLEREAGCALGVGAFYLALFVLSRGGLGFGDVKLGAIAGLVLGSRGVRQAIGATVLAYLITLVVIAVMLLRHRKQFPYGPGILAGALLMLLL